MDIQGVLRTYKLPKGMLFFEYQGFLYFPVEDEQTHEVVKGKVSAFIVNTERTHKHAMAFDDTITDEELAYQLDISVRTFGAYLDAINKG